MTGRLSVLDQIEAAMLSHHDERWLPIFRKTGTRIMGTAYTRARDIELVMDNLRDLVALAKTARDVVDPDEPHGWDPERLAAALAPLLRDA